MLRHQPHICRFPIWFSVNAKPCVITRLLLQHRKSRNNPALPNCPASLDGRGWRRPRTTRPTARNKPSSHAGAWVRVLTDSQEKNLSRGARQSKHAVTTPEVRESAGELVDKGYRESQEHGCSVPLSPFGEASISLITKQSTSGEIIALCLFILHHILLTAAQDTVRGQGDILSGCNGRCD